MAKARVNKKKGVLGMELPECPICLEVMTAPIYNCQSGHSLCSGCSSNLRPRICPLCRQSMTDMRNRALEDLISQAVVSCPNKGDGCVYTILAQDMNKHLKECIFRKRTCPYQAVFGTCAWNGNLNDLYKHFKDCHPNNCDISTNCDIELDDISVMDDKRNLFLVTHGKLLFILTVKIVTAYKAAYWIVQHIGSKKTAQQHVYEIHIVSEENSRRKAMFLECCYNDEMQADEIFREGKCGVLPLSMLKHFIKDKKLVFKFSIERNPVNTNPKFEKVEGNLALSTGQSDLGPQQPQPRGPGPRGRGARRPNSRGPAPRGPSPHETRPQGPSSQGRGPRGPTPRGPKP